MKEYFGVLTDLGVRTIKGNYWNYSHVNIGERDVENLQVIDSLALVLRSQWAAGDELTLTILERRGEHFVVAITQSDGQTSLHPVQPLIDEAYIFVMVGLLFGFSGLQLSGIQGMCRVAMLLYALAALGTFEAIGALNVVRKLRMILVDCIRTPRY